MFVKPCTSIAKQRLPLLIVCLGLFRMDWHCTDRSVRGIRCCGSDWKADCSLDRSRGAVSVLSSDRLIGLCGTDAPRTSQLCRASEPKHEKYCDVRPGSVLAL